MVALGLLVATILVACFFAYVYGLKRQMYLLLWTSAWSMLALHYLSAALEPQLVASPWQQALDHWLLAASGVLFFLGTQLYAQRKAWVGQAASVAALLLAWAIAS